MINTNSWKSCVVLLSSLFISACAFAKVTYHCPEKVQLKSAVLVNGNAPEKWGTAVTDAPLWLTNVAVYDGPVADNAALVPNEGSANTSKWLFEGDFKNGKFASCEYGNGVVKLEKAIEKTATSCVATVKNPAIKRVGIEADFVCTP